MSCANFLKFLSFSKLYDLDRIFSSAMFSRIMSTGSQFVMEGVKSLVVGNKVGIFCQFGMLSFALAVVNRSCSEPFKVVCICS